MRAYKRFWSFIMVRGVTCERESGNEKVASLFFILFFMMYCFVFILYGSGTEKRRKLKK